MPAIPIAIIILAAGSSSRLGRPKQLLEYRGQTLIRRVVRSAVGANLGPIILIISSELSDAVREQITEEPVEIVENAERETGLSSSICAGLSFALRKMPDLSAVILALCDQPQITSDTFLKLADVYRRERKPVVASEYSATVGVPALFDRSMFDELLTLRGDRGAKSLILARIRDIGRIEAPEAAFDVDSIEDLERNEV